ncbi:hypothetical protein Tco_0912035 [Tanacetum coccineum]
MASDGNDQDAEYAISKLLQIDEAFSLAREAKTRFANLDIYEFLRSNPSTLGEDFFKARITEAHFEIIAKEDKEHIIEKKIDVILPLQGEFASPKAKGSLNADGFIGVEKVVGGGEKLGIGEDDDLGDAATDGGDDIVKSDDISILNSLIGHGSPREMLRRQQQQQIAMNAKIQRRLWDPVIKIFFRHHPEDKVKYEWKWIRCGSCSVFGHDDSQCPKRMVSKSGANLGVDPRSQNGPNHMNNVVAQNDEFQMVQNSIPKEARKCGKYRTTTSKNNTINMASSSTNKGTQNSNDINVVTLKNSFEALKEKDKIFENVGTLIDGNVGNTVMSWKRVIHPQEDGRSERMIQTLEDIMRACVIDFGSSYHLRIRCALFEALYGRKLLVKEKPKARRNHQKSYADKRRNPLEFEVGDQVLLKVSPWKGVVCFGKKGKLAPRYVEPFEILERIGLVAYRLRLPEELSSVYDTFHVLNLKKCLADANLHVPLDKIKVDKILHFVKEPVEIMDREIKKLKHRKIAPVKVRWNLKRGPEFTWEHEDQMRITFKELSQKFLEEFSQQKRYAKDPTEIHGIKRRQNKGLQAFMDRFKSESSHIKGVPLVLRISAFMHGHGHPKLAKKLNDKIPKTVDEMFERVRAFIRGEVAAGSAEMVRPSQGGPEKARNRGGPREVQRNMGVYTPYPRKDTFTLLIKTLKEILAMESVSFPEPTPLIGTPEKQNLNKFCDYHGDRGHDTNDCYQLKKQIEEVMASRKLAHLVKDIRRTNQRNGSQ